MEKLTIDKLAKITGTKSGQISETYAGYLPHKTESVCPECTRIVQALVYEKNGKVWMDKDCPEHGVVHELYWEDFEMYDHSRKFGTKSRKIENPNMGSEENLGVNCPHDCGLCTRHKSHTALGNLAVTNRCDLSCWYCFFYAKEGDPIYEPSLKQIENMLKNYRNELPVGTKAIQFTGGEPTLREDLVEIIKMAKDLDFKQIQLNTHSINIAHNPDLAKRLGDAGVNVVYTSFDGVTPKTNPKNHWEMPYALDAYRKSNVNVVLVPTVIRTVNDHEVGKIINFGLNNMDVIKSVNFQPVSLVGKMPAKEREKQRITIPGTIKEIEKQTNGIVAREDWFSVPCSSKLTHFVEALTSEPQYDLSIHFACGMGSYLYVDKGKVLPITRFIDVFGLTDYLEEKAQEMNDGKSKMVSAGKVLLKINSFVDKKYAPKELKFGKLLFNALIKNNYSAFAELNNKMMFLGMMHFMDKYNYDVERVERCDIHYVMPDGRIVPFCAFNVLPEIYRDKVQSQYSYTVEEWKKLHPDYSREKELYRRDLPKLKEGAPYKKAYEGVNNYFEA